MKYFVFLSTMLVSISAFSDHWAGGLKIDKMYGSGYIHISVDNAPSNTCDYYSWDFRFDATTDEGKNMFSMLLAAQMSDRPIEVWYTASSAAEGATESNGCSKGTMAVIYDVAVD